MFPENGGGEGGKLDQPGVLVAIANENIRSNGRQLLVRGGYCIVADAWSVIRLCIWHVPLGRTSFWPRMIFLV